MKPVFLSLIAALLLPLSSGAQTVPVVSMRADPARTSEPIPTAIVVPGKFIVARSGSRDLPLQVFLQYSGTASAEDCERLPESVIIPAGAEATSFLVLARSDNLVEGTETLVAAITRPSGEGTVPPYSISLERARAVVEIADEDKLVEPLPEIPVISVHADPAETSEPAPLIRVAPAAFLFKRAGRIDRELRVYFRVEGTATPGADYEKLPESVVFAAGKEIAVAHVAALDDQVVEGDETVVAAIIQPPTAIAVVQYQISREHPAARVVIHDTDRRAEATITITQPKAGAVLPAGRNIEIEAVAIDPASYINRLEFFANDRLIGVSEIVFIRAPDPGTPIHHSLTWTNPAAGVYELTARGVSAGGRIVSAPVRVTVGEVPAGPRVSLFAPRNGSVFALGSNVEIRAAAGEREEVARLEVFVNERLLASSDGRNLFVLWMQPPAGTHVIKARATNSKGATEEKISVLVRREGDAVLTERPASLESPKVEERDSKSIRLQLKGSANQTCRLEVSTDLIHWTDVGEYFLPEGQLEFEDNAETRLKFYRLR